MPEPLSSVPDRLIGGDTCVVRWAEPSDYAVAAGWSHALTLQGYDGASAAATAASSAGLLTFTIAAAATGGLTAGPATWAWTATLSGARYTLGTGRLQVLPDPSSDQSSSELAHIERVIAACQARLEGKVTEDVLMFQLPDGVMLQKLPLNAIHQLLAQYKAKRRALLNAGRPRVREVWYATR